MGSKWEATGILAASNHFYNAWVSAKPVTIRLQRLPPLRGLSVLSKRWMNARSVLWKALAAAVPDHSSSRVFYSISVFELCKWQFFFRYSQLILEQLICKWIIRSAALFVTLLGVSWQRSILRVKNTGSLIMSFCLSANNFKTCIQWLPSAQLGMSKKSSKSTPSSVPDSSRSTLKAINSESSISISSFHPVHLATLLIGSSWCLG